MSDRDILISHNQFIRNDQDDRNNIHKWEVRVARNYYNKLFKELVFKLHLI